ncbi:hypothetical protein L873DRAFT_1756741 [Choiromyces venosus 120613-1]|uniref:PiggyBac transposable element-derived protein domain-containing protein n=1 Tax=Choiromyces venosus 120613-1 TaxID=1336337 RepID=A0A3N4K6R7_9PEZI|nr:hypothetical protein L873DRAFT_1756741 [Choiromyces venosus 120613-1]
MNSCPWLPIMVELKIWLAVVIYMRLHPTRKSTEYWHQDGFTPIHLPTCYISLFHFQQIHCFFHVSMPLKSQEKKVSKNWYYKVKPLSTLLHTACKKYYIPAMNIAIDEIMVSFQGRSSYTLKVPNKLIGKRYQIFSICDAGYTIY